MLRGQESNWRAQLICPGWMHWHNSIAELEITCLAACFRRALFHRCPGPSSVPTMAVRFGAAPLVYSLTGSLLILEHDPRAFVLRRRVETAPAPPTFEH